MAPVDPGLIAARVRAKRGAKWLDEHFPGWQQYINAETLELNDPKQCICGQVFERQAKESESHLSGFDYAYDHLFTEANRWLTTHRFARLPEGEYEVPEIGVASALGFDSGIVPGGRAKSDPVYVDHWDLQMAWVELLEKRADG